MSSIEELKKKVNQILQQKRQGMRVDNDLHRAAVELAKQKLAQKFTGLVWETAAGNQSGIDIQGFLHQQLDVACEVVGHDLYKGHRRDNVNEDLRRLKVSGAQHKFLAVVYPDLKEGLARAPSVQELLSDVEVICLLEEQV